MRLKPGVSLKLLQPQTVVAMIVADGVWNDLGAELVVTSGNDGTHMPTSLHYQGKAFDCRTHVFEEGQAARAVEILKAALGAEFDVILEHLGEPQEHCHVENQPKT